MAAFVALKNGRSIAAIDPSRRRREMTKPERRRAAGVADRRPALPIIPSQAPARRLPFTSFPTISRMIVSVSSAASLGGKAVSAILQTSFVMS